MTIDVLPGGATSPAPHAATSGVPGSIRLWQAVAAAHAALTIELEADGGTCPVLAADAFAVLSRRRHTRSTRDWSSDVCSSDLIGRAHV